MRVSSRPDRLYPQSNNQNRQPFRPSNGSHQNQNRFQPRTQRAYQASVEDGEIDPDHPFAEDYSGANQDSYQYEEAAPEESFYGHEEDANKDLVEDYVEQYFSKALPSSPDYQCEKCDHKATSRNKLFLHPRGECWKTKSFIGYPSVTILGQRVDGLGMSTSQEKIQAITALKFPETLRDLEIFLGLTGWLRSSIPRYAQLANPLQERKTILTKGLGSGVKGPTRKPSATKVLFYEPTRPELDAFHKLQEAFSSPTFLAHYDASRPLLVDLDASKSFGFAAMVYHLKQDRIPEAEDRIARTDVQPVMFLSRCLNAAERNYWPTELEVAGIVWVVKKVRHMIESSQKPPVIIYTDHSAAVPISRQTSLNTSSTDKLNLRLVRASYYLSSFNLELRHKAGKSNTVPDALSRLPQTTEAPPDGSGEGVLDSLFHAAEAYGSSTTAPEPVPIYHSTLVEMSDDFKQRLKQAYLADQHWVKLHEMSKAAAADPGTETIEKRVPGIPFVLKDQLMYHVNAEGR